MTPEAKIVAWLRDMAKRAPDSGHGLQGYVASKLWDNVADRIEAGDHEEHARRVAAGRDRVVQAGPAQPEATEP